MMKRKKINSEIEEKIIIAMITSKEFLAQIVPALEIDLFSADHFKKIAGWCTKYFNKYHKAPDKYIETIYNSWVSKGKAKEETVDSIHDILEEMSDNYEEQESMNIPYLLDEASKLFSLRKIEGLRDELDFSLVESDTSMADNAVNSFRNVRLGENRGIDVFRDRNAFTSAFSAAQKPLFTIGPKETQRFFANAFCRDNLIAILAPEKRGKTFWCVEFPVRALMSRRKVALFEVGDMSEAQIMKRIGVRFVGRPMYRNQCGEISIPTKIMKRKNKRVRIAKKTRLIKNPATEKECKIAVDKFMRRFGISSEHPYFKVSTHANSSVSVSNIFGILDKWEAEEGFIPDVIVIDYPDIMADEPNTGNYSARDKENVKWKALRRLSQEKHCLVIAPTQADAASYEVDTLSAKNFSEDKRKLSHVTGMLGLNQTWEEKNTGIMRLNWIVLREAPFSIDRCLYVGQCLPLARSFCCGYF